MPIYLFLYWYLQSHAYPNASNTAPMPLDLKSMFVGFVLGKAEIWVLHSMRYTSIWDFVCYHYAVTIVDYCVELLTQSH